MTSSVTWEGLVVIANTKATTFGITDPGMRNAFAHTYVSAVLTQRHGDATAFVLGSGLELHNHWTNRNGGVDPLNDPNQRYDTFRDLWNNAVGREIGRIAVHNNWNEDQTAEFARNAVTGGVAISDPYNDVRVPVGLSQYSTFDYLFGGNYPKNSDIHSVAPPGTNIPPNYPSIGGDFAALQGTEQFTADDGATFTLTKNPDGTTTFRAFDAADATNVNYVEQRFTTAGVFSASDTLAGGGGNDNLSGGAGTDTFVFGANWGADTVWDWTDGEEQFNLQGSGATGFGDLTVDQDYLGSGNALIAFGASQILVVGGANKISAGDFVF